MSNPSFVLQLLVSSSLSPGRPGTKLLHSPLVLISCNRVLVPYNSAPPLHTSFCPCHAIATSKPQDKTEKEEEKGASKRVITSTSIHTLYKRSQHLPPPLPFSNLLPMQPIPQMHLKILQHLPRHRRIQFPGTVVTPDPRHVDDLCARRRLLAGVQTHLLRRVGGGVDGVGAHDRLEVRFGVAGAEGLDCFIQPGRGWGLGRR